MVDTGRVQGTTYLVNSNDSLVYRLFPFGDGLICSTSTYGFNCPFTGNLNDRLHCLRGLKHYMSTFRKVTRSFAKNFTIL